MQNTNRKCRLNAQTIILTASFARLWNQTSLQAALNIRRYPVACKGQEMWFCQILGWMSWHYLIATVVASQLKALLWCLPRERVETRSFRWEGDLCFVWQPLSFEFRRGSDKGQPADAVGRVANCLCKRIEVEAVTLGGPAAVPGMLQNTPAYLVWGWQNSCQVLCFGCTCVLWISGQSAAQKQNLTPKYFSGAGGLMASSHHRTDFLQDLSSNSCQEWWFVIRRFTDLQLWLVHPKFFSWNIWTTLKWTIEGN